MSPRKGIVVLLLILLFSYNPPRMVRAPSSNTREVSALVVVRAIGDSPVVSVLSNLSAVLTSSFIFVRTVPSSCTVGSISSLMPESTYWTFWEVKPVSFTLPDVVTTGSRLPMWTFAFSLFLTRILGLAKSSVVLKVFAKSKVAEGTV